MRPKTITSRVCAWPWQVWHFKPTVETALAKEKDLLAGAEGPTIAVHLRGGDKRQENADLVRGPHTTVLQAGVSKLCTPHTCGAPATGAAWILCSLRCAWCGHYCLLCSHRPSALLVVSHKLHASAEVRVGRQWCRKQAHTTAGSPLLGCDKDRAAALEGTGSMRLMQTRPTLPAQGRPNTLPEDYAHAFREAYPDVKACPSLSLCASHAVFASPLLMTSVKRRFPNPAPAAPASMLLSSPQTALFVQQEVCRALMPAVTCAGGHVHRH